MNQILKAWSEADLDLLRRRWSEGASDSQIARELGWRHTRNAVIGMRHRSGFSRDPRFAPVVRRKNSTQGALNFSNRPTKNRPPYDPSRKEVVPIAVRPERVIHRSPPVDATPQRSFPAGAVTLVDLRPHHGRWIADDGAYCGKTRDSPRPYCVAHCDVAYEPSAPSKNQRPLYHGRKK